MPINRLARSLGSLRESTARLLWRAGVSPFHITAMGLALACASGWLFYAGRFRWAAVVLLLSGCCDLFDGAVARVSGRVTAFGAFLDSTVDRLSDAAILCGILLYYDRAETDTYSAVTAAYLVLVGSFLVSYTRARAESIIGRCSVGIFQRPERVIVLAAAGLTGVTLMPAVLWFLVAATGFTVFQRVVYVWRSIRNGSAGGPARPGDAGRAA